MALDNLHADATEPPPAARALSSSERRRVLLYCLLAGFISGSCALYIALTGGLTAGNGLNFLLLAVWYMPGPALAHILTRLLTREGWQNLGLRPRLRQGWPAWLLAWFTPALLTLLGMALYFLIFPQYFDAGLGVMREQMAQMEMTLGQALPFTLGSLLALQMLAAIVIGPILNALPTLGEEFGWRAYLQPKLMALGWRRAMVWMGIIWGVWHWPIIALGYNYGLDYPGAPWLGMLVFVWFTFCLGTLLGWLALRGRSVWPAVIGHGALNAIANAAVLVTQGMPSPLLGPAPIGLIGGAGFALAAIWLWVKAPGLAENRGP